MADGPFAGKVSPMACLLLSFLYLSPPTCAQCFSHSAQPLVQHAFFLSSHCYCHRPGFHSRLHNLLTVYARPYIHLLRCVQCLHSAILCPEIPAGHGVHLHFQLYIKRRFVRKQGLQQETMYWHTLGCASWPTIPTWCHWVSVGWLDSG